MNSEGDTSRALIAHGLKKLILTTYNTDISQTQLACSILVSMQDDTSSIVREEAILAYEEVEQFCRTNSVKTVSIQT